MSALNIPLVMLLLISIGIPIASSQLLPPADCDVGDARCNWGGQEAVMECSDGYNWVVKENCLSSEICTINDLGEPVCKTESEYLVQNSPSNGVTEKTFYFVAGAIISLILVGIILLTLKKKN